MYFSRVQLAVANPREFLSLKVFHIFCELAQFALDSTNNVAVILKWSPFKDVLFSEQIEFNMEGHICRLGQAEIISSCWLVAKTNLIVCLMVSSN